MQYCIWRPDPAGGLLADRLLRAANRGVRVRLLLEFVPGPGPCKECGSIVWISQENGREVRYTHEPRASFSRKLKVFLLSFLPIESQI